MAINLGHSIRRLLLSLLLPAFEIPSRGADAETIIQQMSQSMVGNRLLLSLPLSPRWIVHSSVTITLAGLGVALGASFYAQNERLFFLTYFAVLVLIACLVLAHEWLHWFLIKLSCPIWQRLHPTFDPQPIRVESRPGWPRFVRTALYTDMKCRPGSCLP